MTSSRISEHFPARRAFGRPARPAWPLMSYSRGRGTVPLRDDTVGQALRRTVERFGDQDALLVPHQGYRATFSEFWAQVGQAARALLALEVRKGDRIGIWSPNRYEWVVTQFATARVGAILVTIDPDSQATELQYALSKAGVSWLLMARGYRDTDYVATLARVRADCPQLRAPISLDDDWAEFMAAGAHVTDARLAEREATLDTNDPITIQFTPGGTGTPKGATLSHHSIVNTPHQVANTVGNTGGCRADGTIPLHHHFAPVLGTLARVMQGAAIAWPSEPFDQAVHRSVPVVRALPHMEIKIVDPRTGTTVPRGTAGEYCTRGYSVMIGYWDDPAATAAAIDDQGWLHSGDLAVMDVDGSLRITARITDVTGSVAKRAA